MSEQSSGLAVYLTIYVATGLALAWDWSRDLHGLPTISETVRAHLLLSIPLYAFLLAGILGLNLHFFGKAN